MQAIFHVSDHVNNVINALPQAMQAPIRNALEGEILAGVTPENILTPIQMMVYVMIRDCYRREMRRTRTA